MNAKQTKPGLLSPLSEDPLAFIRGASNTPPAAVVGAGELTHPAAEEGGKAPAEKAPATDKKPAATTATRRGRGAATAQKDLQLPWADANPRVEVKMQLRFDEVSHAKLKWLSENTPNTSMHKIAMDAVLAEIAKRLAEKGVG